MLVDGRFRLASFPFKIRISPDVISQEVLLGETLLMDVKTLTYFGLDALGSNIWHELQQCDDADEVFRRLRSTAALDDDVLERKFSGIIKGLEVSGIITLQLEASDTSSF